MRVLAVIPARSGSKGINHKNLLKINNLSLLEHAVIFALGHNAIDEVVVSTDSEEYERLAVSRGAKSMGLRDAKLSSDTAKSSDVVLDILVRLDQKFDVIVLLQPTSPVRKYSDLDAMLTKLNTQKADACVSVAIVDEPHPYKLKKINGDGFIRSFVEGASSEIPRQQLPPAYKLTGAFYVVKVKSIMDDKTFFPSRTIPHITDEGVNIDNINDYDWLNFLISNNMIEWENSND